MLKQKRVFKCRDELPEKHWRLQRGSWSMWLSHLCLPGYLFIFKLRLLPSYRNWELEVLSLLILTGMTHCVELHFIVLLGYFFFFSNWRFISILHWGFISILHWGLCQSCTEQVYWGYFFFSSNICSLCVSCVTVLQFS